MYTATDTAPTAVAAVGYTGVYYNTVTCTAMQQYGNAVLICIAVCCSTAWHLSICRWIDGDELLAITSRDTPSVSPMTYRALHALVVMVMSAYVLHTLVVLPLGSESVTYCIT